MGFVKNMIVLPTRWQFTKKSKYREEKKEISEVSRKIQQTCASA